jgi:putative heme iron utilization protein
MSEGAEARRFLRSRRHGVLATLSRKFDGYPFGSVAPFVLDHEARPVIFISRLAEHTRNIEADSRVSLLVNDAGENVQAGARLTLVGDAARAGGDLDALRMRYLEYVPGAEKLMALSDFGFYAITPRALRFIGGFGQIHWVSAANYSPPANRMAEQEMDILAHMNADHAHNLRDYCRHYHGRTANATRMAGIDCDGFDIRADGELLRFDFDMPVTDAASAREALVEMARKSRAA